ncbi:MAG TPA: YfiR family protein [Noviherbaspirillum sp.]
MAGGINYVRDQTLLPDTPESAHQTYALINAAAGYVSWPADVFADDRSPWRICIPGNDPLGDILDKTLTGRFEQGRAFQILRAETLNELPRCQIVYIGYKDAAKHRAALAELKKLPVLTVSDAPEFLQEGGIIQFHIGDRVEMSINPGPEH